MVLIPGDARHMLAAHVACNEGSASLRRRVKHMLENKITALDKNKNHWKRQAANGRRLTQATD